MMNEDKRWTHKSQLLVIEDLFAAMASEAAEFREVAQTPILDDRLIVDALVELIDTIGYLDPVVTGRLNETTSQPLTVAHLEAAVYAHKRKCGARGLKRLDVVYDAMAVIISAHQQAARARQSKGGAA